MSSFNTIMSNIQAAMSELSNTSVSALFAKFAEACGQVIDTVLAEISNTQTIITNIITTQNYGKSNYYINAALAFQYGKDLSTDANGNYYYPTTTTDPTIKIITQAAFVNTNTGLVLKVATTDPSTGLLTALSGSQLSAFQTYMQLFEIPGLPLLIVSNTGNTLAFNMTITYNAAYNLQNIQSLILTWLNNFQSSFTFNGTFYNYQLESYLVQNVPGVVDVYLFSTTIDGVGFAGNTILDSGYFNYASPINNGSSTPGNINITYQTQ